MRQKSVKGKKTIVTLVFVNTYRWNSKISN